MEMRKRPPDARHTTNILAGAIKSLDPIAHTITLETGKVCRCDPKLELSKFKSGDKVKMTFRDANGTSECCELVRAA
jgi:Cu/Ag efflux protein CusF